MSAFAEGLASAIPGARTHRIEGAGHAAPFDATANFVELIADSVAASAAAAPPAATTR